jgi:hypothetical protein
MSIRATCPCGKAFLAKPELAGKLVRCPSCGQPFQVPMPAAAPTNGDPLGIGDLSQMEFGAAPVAAAQSPLLSTPTTYSARPARSKDGPGKGLIVGLIIGGVVLAGIVGIGLIAALVLPAIQAARHAAQVAGGNQGGGGNPGGGSQGGGAWQKHESAEGGYSISMPGRPTIRSQLAPVAGGGLLNVTNAVMDLGDRGAYFASHVDAAAGNATWQAPLDACVQEGLSRISGKALASRDVMVAGNPGKDCDFEGTTQGRPFCGRMQIFRSGSVQYQLMWVGPKGKRPDSDLQQFFSSFQLTKKPAPTMPNPASPPVAATPTPPTFPDTTPPPNPPPTPPPGPPGIGVPAKPGELSDVQRKGIYRSLALFDRMSEMSARQADEFERAGQRDAAANIRQGRENGRQQLLRSLASMYGVTEAQAREIYETGKRENWGN